MRDLTQRQFDDACARRGFVGHGIMGYYRVHQTEGGGATLVSVLNAGPKRRDQLAYLCQAAAKAEKDAAKRERDRRDRWDAAFAALPDCVGPDPVGMETIADMADACLTHLDLIAEGQDAAEGDDPAPIRAWLARFAPKHAARSSLRH